MNQTSTECAQNVVVHMMRSSSFAFGLHIGVILVELGELRFYAARPHVLSMKFGSSRVARLSSLCGSTIVPCYHSHSTRRFYIVKFLQISIREL